MKMDPNWDIPDEYLAEMGRVSVRWSRLEGMMELSMIKLLGKDITEGRSLVLFTHLGFPQRMHTLGALVTECMTNPAYHWLSAYKKEVEPLLNEASRLRNDIVHSKWGLNPDGSIGRSNISARGALKFKMSTVQLREIEAASEVIVKAAEALWRLVFSSLPPNDVPQSGQ